MAILENSIPYSVILGVSEFIRCLKNIVLKKTEHSNIGIKVPDMEWTPPASKENPAPEYNCNVTGGIVNLPQATPVKCLANVTIDRKSVV